MIRLTLDIDHLSFVDNTPGYVIVDQSLKKDNGYKLTITSGKHVGLNTRSILKNLSEIADEEGREREREMEGGREEDRQRQRNVQS
ncbi:hypothetical protein ACF0H5_006572 [Mactra antiquata]